jgi:hypothetical protein
VVMEPAQQNEVDIVGCAAPYSGSFAAQGVTWRY